MHSAAQFRPRLEVGGAVSEEAGGADGFGEDDADGDEDGAGSGREGDSDFDASALGIFIAAAKSDAALGKIFANGNFFLKTATWRFTDFADTGDTFA